MVKKRLVVALLGAVLLLAGCGAKGDPKAVAPVTQHDFGDVPVTSDMKNLRTKEFVIQNQGTADLKLSDVQVKLLQGC